MNAEALRQLYEAQLRYDLRPPVAEHVDRWATRKMVLQTERRPGGTLRPEEHGRTWIWSDLHIGHYEILTHANRPFATVTGMNKAIHDAWDRTVGDADTIICLGDVAVPAVMYGYGFDSISAMPGHKVLVFGNHDLDHTGAIPEMGFDEVHPTLYAETDPPLLLTHMPLRKLPAGFVNVHGHTHDNVGARWPLHVNVSVEQIHYRPVRLDEIVALARALLDGAWFAGATTAEQIEELHRGG